MLTLRLSVVLVVVACFFFAPSLHAQDHLVVFGGYSYLRPPVTVTETNCPIGNFVCPAGPVFLVNASNRENLNGWELSATYRFLPFLGIAADFSAHYGSVSNSSSSIHQYTGLAGPEVSLPSRVSPFAHLLFGGTHQTVTSGTLTNNPFLFVVGNTHAAFATVFGAGIDLKVIPHVWVRPIQFDYLLTRLNNGTQNQPRISAGLVLHF